MHTAAMKHFLPMSLMLTLIMHSGLTGDDKYQQLQMDPHYGLVHLHRAAYRGKHPIHYTRERMSTMASTVNLVRLMTVASLLHQAPTFVKLSRHCDDLWPW